MAKQTGFAAVKVATRALRRDLDALKREVATLKRQQRSDTVGSSQAGAGGSYLRLASPVHVEYVRISGPKDAAGWWPAKRQMGTAAINSVIDDDELTQIFKVFPVGGASPFVEAAGHIILWDALGTPPENYWQTLSGEWMGFPAKLTTGVPDTSESYTWQQIGTAPYRQALSETSGTPALGRAWDYSYFSRDPAAPQTARVSYPANQPIWLFRDPLNNRMAFYARRELDSGPC